MTGIKDMGKLLLPFLLLWSAACGGSEENKKYSGDPAEVFPSTEPTELVPAEVLPTADSSGSSKTPTSQSGASKTSSTPTKSTSTKKKKNQPQTFRGALDLSSNTCADAVSSIQAKFLVKRKRSAVTIELSNGLVLRGSGDQNTLSASVTVPQAGGASVRQTISAEKVNRRSANFSLELAIFYPDNSSCAAVYEGRLKKRPQRKK